MTPGEAFPFRPDHYPVVAVGIDTLHYSAPIDLKKSVVNRLEALKDAAKEDRAELLWLGGTPRSHGAAASPGVPFVMQARSIKRYRFGLQCEEFGISVWLTDSKNVPGVKVELGSQALWHFGQEEAYALSKRIVAELCEVGQAFDTRPSRVDFTVDFQGVQFQRDMALAMVSRARRRPDFEQLRGLCVSCDAPFLDERATVCAVCAEPRKKVLEVERELAKQLVHDLAGKPTKKHKAVRVRTLICGERSPNPHMMPRGAMLEAGALPMQRYGGQSRRPFTGWQFGGAGELMVRIYNKCIEVQTKSPEKVWFYETWNRADGYVHSYCPGCGREHAKAVVLAHDAPLLADELPVSRPKLTKKQQAIRSAVGLDEEPPPSGLPRLAARLCTFCDVEHRVIPVWRCEVQARGSLLTRIAPDGKNPIASVEDVIKNSDEIWSILVGEANRHCKQCGAVPIGKGQRWRICRPCLEQHQVELGRKLDFDDEDDRALMRPYRMVRRAGWLEARDASKNPDGKTSSMPVLDWWRHLQTVHFEFSAPATSTSTKVKHIVSADINRTMARGCITSWASSIGFMAKLTQKNGRPPTAAEFKEALLREMFAEDDPLELYATVAYKDVSTGQPFLPLTPSTVKPPGPVDTTYCRGCGEVGVWLEVNDFCANCQMPPPQANRRRPGDRSEVN